MNLRNLFFSVMATAFLCVFFPAVASAQSGIVNAENLNIRTSCDTSSNVITTLPKGSAVDILSHEGDWFFVKLPDGNLGYAAAGYVTPTEAYFGKITTPCYVYSNTGLFSPVISSVSEGMIVELLAYDGVWYKIRTPYGQEGFVAVQNIEHTNLTMSLFKDDGYSYGYIASSVANLHSTVGDYAPVLKVLPKGCRVQLLAYDGFWYQVATADNVTGYINAKRIVPYFYTSIEEGVPASYGYIDASALNIRLSTGISSDILTTLPCGTQLTILNYDGFWYQVALSDGQVGFASADFISPVPVAVSQPVYIAQNPTEDVNIPPAPAPTAEELELGRAIVDTAHEYLGIPYSYSAAGPDSFDCSGFTMYIMALYDINLPHQSKEQYTYGCLVTKDELIPGDLVFFKSANTTSVAHVGIYIGNGEFIHASSGSAYSVTISSLSADYYTRHYLGARRVL